MNQKPTIPDHWDTSNLISSTSIPDQEFAIWQAHAAANPGDWRGDEFTLADFAEYICTLNS